jgi:hypothetical protein
MESTEQTDNAVVVVGANLAALATSIRTCLAKAEASRKDWLTNMLAVAEALALARKQFKADRDFGRWLDEQRITLAPADRAAAIKIGENIELAKAAGTIETRSLRQFWIVLECRFSDSEDRKLVATATMPVIAKAGRPRKPEQANPGGETPARAMTLQVANGAAPARTLRLQVTNAPSPPTKPAPLALRLIDAAKVVLELAQQFRPEDHADQIALSELVDVLESVAATCRERADLLRAKRHLN